MPFPGKSRAHPSVIGSWRVLFRPGMLDCVLSRATHSAHCVATMDSEKDSNHAPICWSAASLYSGRTWYPTFQYPSDPYGIGHRAYVRHSAQHANQN